MYNMIMAACMIIDIKFMSTCFLYKVNSKHNLFKKQEYPSLKMYEKFCNHNISTSVENLFDTSYFSKNMVIGIKALKETF